MQHKFIRSARKTSYLTELIERYQDYRARSPSKGGQQTISPAITNNEMWESNGTIHSDWNFDTIKTNSVMGTFRSMARDLLPSGMDVDKEVEGSISGEEDQSLYTSAATKGSDPLFGSAGFGMNMQAAHSTMVIRHAPDELDSRDVPSLLVSGGISSSGESSSSIGPATPSQPPDAILPLDAPSAYTGSVRVSQRSSYAARHDTRGAGTVMRETDLGTGVDTIRPVNKVDTMGSLRLSAEFVGSRREGGRSSPSSPSPLSSAKDRLSHKRSPSELAKASNLIVGEVVLPILQNVSFSHFYNCTEAAPHVAAGHSRRHGRPRNRVAKHAVSWLHGA